MSFGGPCLELSEAIKYNFLVSNVNTRTIIFHSDIQTGRGFLNINIDRSTPLSKLNRVAQQVNQDRFKLNF